MNRTVTVGLTVLAGAALIEAALIPGLVIGAAAILAPKFLGRRLGPAVDAVRRQAAALLEPAEQPAPDGTAAPTLRIGQAVAKTITFRIIVTALDFSTNLLVIGELNAAAGLSAFGLVAGPVLYLAHEAGWNYLGAAEGDEIVVFAPDAKAGEPSQGGFTISRPIAKTITFRGIATVVDFTASYVVVQDIATAAGLTAFGFFLGPFVYYGHEKAWDYFTARPDPAPAPAPPKLLPAPA
jgi:uncharacterized membrane protein